MYCEVFNEKYSESRFATKYGAFSEYVIDATLFRFFKCGFIFRFSIWNNVVACIGLRVSSVFIIVKGTISKSWSIALVGQM